MYGTMALPWTCILLDPKFTREQELSATIHAELETIIMLLIDIVPMNDKTPIDDD